MRPTFTLPVHPLTISIMKEQQRVTRNGYLTNSRRKQLLIDKVNSRRQRRNTTSNWPQIDLKLGHFGVIFVSVSCHFGAFFCNWLSSHCSVIFTSFSCHFTVNFHNPAPLESHFSVIFTSCLCQFCVILLSFYCHFHAILIYFL